MSNKARRDLAEDTTRAIIAHWDNVAPDDRIAHLIRHASRGLRRALEFRLAEHEVSFGHWMFLRILWREDGLSQRELSVRAGVMEPTTHRAIARMETLGLVARREATPGRKRQCVFLTDRGRALESTLTPLAEDVNRVALANTVPEDVERMRATLLLMVRNLAEDEIAQQHEGRRILSTRMQAER